MSEQVVIGIDGGGTRLRAAIVSCSGELLGLGEGGSGNYHDVGANQVRTNISEAVSQAWTAFDNSPREVAAIFLGLEGYFPGFSPRSIDLNHWHRGQWQERTVAGYYS